jgi:hypothetical protein
MAYPTDAGFDGSDDGGSDGQDAGTTAPSGLHVVRGTNGMPGHILDGMNQLVQLHGANRSGTESSCTYGQFSDGPVDQAGVDAMKSWKINSVRVPLNEDCWLGLNGWGGASYRTAIQSWVQLLTSNGLIAVVDLHWSAPGTEQAIGQLPMADADHSIDFWKDVAATFGGNGAVIFDLFNEPNVDTWDCWANGGMCAKNHEGNDYNVAGMVDLLKAVRGTGAQNVVILGGLSYAGDVTQWVQTVEGFSGVSLDNVAASMHMYDFNSLWTGCPSQFNGYSSTCYSTQTSADNQGLSAVVAAGYPIIVGETGISAYQSSTPFSGAQVQELEAWLNGMLGWLEQNGQGYLAWSWNTDTPPVLVTDYQGSPTPGFGEAYKAHLAQF